jgi:hypothetical protein
MNHEQGQPTPDWLDDLDAIIAGHESPAASEDELLQLAQQLTERLTPLRRMDRAAEQRRQHLLGRLHATQSKQPARARSALLVALLLMAVLASGTVGAGTLWSAASHVWNAATSLQQVQGISIAHLARPRPGLHPLPLLPVALPRDTDGAAYGVIADAHDPNLLKVFVADYRIAGRDVSLYEQPSSFPLTSLAAHMVRIGALEGQVFQDEAGNHALQWYQDGMECQLTSTLPVDRLVALASVFQPIKEWELFR